MLQQLHVQGAKLRQEYEALAETAKGFMIPADGNGPSSDGDHRLPGPAASHDSNSHEHGMVGTGGSSD